VQRNFGAPAPDRLRVCDLTYIRTWVGFAYLGIVVEVFSRRILGWALATHLRTELPLEALQMADLDPRAPAAGPAGAPHRPFQPVPTDSIHRNARCHRSIGISRIPRG
jgi:putative transposase